MRPVIDINTKQPILSHDEEVVKAQELYNTYHEDIPEEDLRSHPLMEKHWDSITKVPIPNNVISLVQFKERKNRQQPPQGE